MNVHFLTKANGDRSIRSSRGEIKRRRDGPTVQLQGAAARRPPVHREQGAWKASPRLLRAARRPPRRVATPTQLGCQVPSLLENRPPAPWYAPYALICVRCPSDWPYAATTLCLGCQVQAWHRAHTQPPRLEQQPRVSRHRLQVAATTVPLVRAIAATAVRAKPNELNAGLGPTHRMQPLLVHPVRAVATSTHRSPHACG
jgi:hypothetical protein